jgi:hypothetical protein
MDVQPVTWELPTAGAACWLALLLILLPAGQGAASWLFGGGFTWPLGTQPLLRSIGGLLTGHPGVGLTDADAARVAPTALVYPTVAVGELLLLGLSICAAVLWWRHLGPGARQGMADRGEVRNVLGVSNLRRKRSVIRPDLHPPAAGRQRSS